jgi:hypothetical protein
VGEVAESEGVAAQGFQSSVDGFGGAVGGVVVEEREDVVAAAPQGAAELGDLFESCGHAAADRVDQPAHRLLAGAAVGVGVGGDDLLVDHVGHLDRDVFVGVEHAGQPVVLARREKVCAGAGDAPDPVERVTGVPSPPEGLLLNTLADQIQLGPGQRDDVERVHHG